MMMRPRVSEKVVTTRDEGSALVAVIGVMVVLTILVMTIVSTSLFNVRTTTQTRSNVEARAAAEAGIAYVRANLGTGLVGLCDTGIVKSPPGWPDGSSGRKPSFEVAIYQSSTRNSAPTCPLPGVALPSIVLVATGTSAASTAGSGTGSSRKVEALLESAVTSAPVFNAAIYSGQDATVSSDLNVTGTGADIVTGGAWLCDSKQSVDGSIYAAKDVEFKSGPCAIKGSVYAGGDFRCPSASSIGKNLYVQGKATLKTPFCSTGGDIWTGGGIDESRGINAGGNVTVGGNLFYDDPILVSGAIRVGGLIAGGSGDQNSKYGKFMKLHPAALQNQAVGLPPSGASVTAMDFPKLQVGNSIWSGFVNKSWKAAVEPLRKPGQGMSVCDMSWGPGVFSAPLIVTENSVYNTTSSSECSGSLGMGSGFTIRLGADAVIFSNKFNMTGDIRVESLDGNAHSLYIITPYPAAQTSCATPVGGSSISFPWGNWTQDDKTSVMLYSAGSVTFTSSPKLRGQIYSCSFLASTRVDLVFSKTGASGVDPSTAKPTLKYVRDVSN